uniref:Uncharacterized protein n=1 Tax=Klebsiella pneumoniae TaxID=573 RepID=A0A8B0SW33_KLEPN|nr:hypothetical protein [Klebsiella pneumoniae]
MMPGCLLSRLHNGKNISEMAVRQIISLATIDDELKDVD